MDNSLIVLWRKLADESASWCCTSATMDGKTVQGRVKHEGLSFLTITLPNFGKDFERSLDQGYVDRQLFQGFSWKGGLPKFLRGFLDLVFNAVDGRLLDAPSTDAILAIRQLTLLYSKLLVPCSQARIEGAFTKYIECEQEVKDHDTRRSQSDSCDFHRVSRLLFGSSLTVLDHVVYTGGLIPKHGPGATADRKIGNAKYDQSVWYRRLEECFPMGEYLLPNWRYFDNLDRVHLLEPGSEQPVRVITVPKTLKTPRIIAIEPTCMMYTQQALLRSLLEVLKKDDYLSEFLGFDDQVPNQHLAFVGSCEGTLATLDLSEASDRVSNQHVRLLLSDHPWLAKSVDSCRSRKADVSGHGVIRLAKFASMGSALCFPFEAMVFLTVTLLGIEKSLNRPITRKDLESLRGKLRIFGDDIIIPVDHVRSVISALENFGFRVNRNKSFWTGKFRESCGKEYYNGTDISIVRFRRLFPSSRRDARETISLLAFRNLLYIRGYWQTCQWLDGKLRDVLRHKGESLYPVVLPSSPALGRHSFLGFETHGVSRDLQSPFVKAFRKSARIPLSPMGEGSNALLKFLIEREARDELTERDARLLHLSPAVDEDHLERSGRPRSVDIKPGRVSPF